MGAAMRSLLADKSNPGKNGRCASRPPKNRVGDWGFAGEETTWKLLCDRRRSCVGRKLAGGSCYLQVESNQGGVTTALGSLIKIGETFLHGDHNFFARSAAAIGEPESLFCGA